MNSKKTFYIASSILLGIILSFIVHALLEMYFINRLLDAGEDVHNYYFLGSFFCALPLTLQWGLLAAGIAGGYFLGQYWWKKVYVEKKHWRWRKKKEIAEE